MQNLEPQRRRNFGESVADSRLPLPLPDDGDDADIADYKFSKFAATHFQNNATSSYIRRALKQPLLPIKNEGDQLVCWFSMFLIQIDSRSFAVCPCRQLENELTVFLFVFVSWGRYLALVTVKSG